MAQKLLLFWRKPARRCWWEGVELHDVEGVPGKLKVWIRRVWTLEMVSLPICVAMNANANNLTERDRAQMSARAGSLVFGPHRTKALYLSQFFSVRILKLALHTGRSSEMGALLYSSTNQASLQIREMCALNICSFALRMVVICYLQRYQEIFHAFTYPSCV